MAKTHCAVNLHLRARQRVPHIATRRPQPMRSFPFELELPPLTRIGQSSGVLAFYLMLLDFASLLLPPFLLWRHFCGELSASAQGPCAVSGGKP